MTPANVARWLAWRSWPDRSEGWPSRRHDRVLTRNHAKALSSWLCIVLAMVHKGRGGAHKARVFAQPWWLRGMNVVASAAIGLLAVSGVLSGKSPSAAAVAGVGVAAVVAMWLGIRAMLSQVTVTSETVRYRGMLRSHEFALSQIVGLRRSRAWHAALAGDVPCLVWRAVDGTSRETTLWCFPVPRYDAVGVTSTEVAVEDLRHALEPFVDRNG